MSSEQMQFTSNVESTITRHLPSDLLVSTMTERVEVGGQQVDLIHVHYRSGNEFIPLAAVLDDLRKLGKTTMEYRGRGVGRETPRIVFDVAGPNGEAASVQWHAV